MKRLISSLSLMVVTIIFCSIQATAQNHRGNGHHNNGNWGNNGNGYGNNGGNNGNYNNHCNNNTNYNNHCGNNGYGNNGYRNNNHCNSGYSVSFGYTYVAPCPPRTVVVYRSTQCAPRPHCRRW